LDHEEYGFVGGMCASLELKLVDIPDMDYLTTDLDDQGRSAPRGEICFKGFGVIPGYYKMPEKTAEAIDKNGWLHTGDVGVVLADTGALKIIDRKKNLFKLSQGEYVAPEKIENLCVKVQYIAEAFVHGDSLKNYIVAFFVLDEPFFMGMCKKMGLTGTFQENAQNEGVRAFIWKDVYAKLKTEGLHGFEIPGQFDLLTESLGVSGLLTQTFKLRRHAAKIQFKE